MFPRAEHLTGSHALSAQRQVWAKEDILRSWQSPPGEILIKGMIKGTAKGQTFKNHPIQTFLYKEMLAIKYVFA